MKPLILRDEDTGKKIFIIKESDMFGYAIVKIKNTDSLSINKSDAEQIINHLKEQFSL